MKKRKPRVEKLPRWPRNIRLGSYTLTLNDNKAAMLDLGHSNYFGAPGFPRNIRNAERAAAWLNAWAKAARARHGKGKR